jgi:hypothetical protein
MKNRFCIFLTASIEPLNTIGLKRNSVIEREDDYFNALVFYLKLGIPIVFCENSMYHSDKISNLVTNNSGKLEYLNFKSLNSHYGKSHGEKEIFDYAHQHSELIKTSDYVVKVTGRLIVVNILYILNKLKLRITDFSISSNLSRNLSYSDSRFFVYKKEFYHEYLEPILSSKLNDWERVYFEVCLAKSIHQRLVEKSDFILLPCYPKFNGKSGATNKSYKKKYFDYMKYKFFFNFKKYFFEHPV